MSQARVHYVKKARKDQGKCERCGTPLPPGSAYLYFQVGFRSRFYHNRCMKAECTPKMSELESSKMAAVWSAQEGFEDAMVSLKAGDPEPDASSIEDALGDFAGSVRETADEYREADEQFGGGGMTDSGERADALESAADELESFNPSTEMADVEPCERHTDEETALEEDDQFSKGDDLEQVRAACDDCIALHRAAWEELIEEAEQFAADVSFEG